MDKESKITAPEKHAVKTLADLRPAIKEYDITMPTGRVFTIQKMTMRQQFALDSRMSEADQKGIMYYRIIGRIASIDGIALPEVNNMQEMQELMDYVDSEEADVLLQDYAKSSGLLDLKNS